MYPAQQPDLNPSRIRVYECNAVEIGAGSCALHLYNLMQMRTAAAMMMVSEIRFNSSGT